MATQDLAGPNDSWGPTADAAINQQILNTNYQYYLDQGGNPSLAQIGPGMSIVQGSRPAGGNPYDPTGGYGGGAYSGGRSYVQYAPYDEGGGHTKWDEFVQQMAYNNSKLAQDKQLQEESLAQQKLIEEDRIAEQKYAANQQSVTDFDKQLNDMRGPKDPYGYLFASRGLAAPQGYSPVGLPLSEAVRQSYQDQGINLADAQKSIVGSSGPSFISGYLGGMPDVAQQGPMGFQNSPGFANVAPGSQPQPQQPPSSGQDNGSGPPKMQPPAQQLPPQFAQGGTVPGYAPGHDTVPAMLSPGEGILKPQTVQALGGPTAITKMNAQHFADGGIVKPTKTTTGGTEYAIARNPNGPSELQPNPAWWPLPGGGYGIPIWTSMGNQAAPVAKADFGENDIQVAGTAGPSGVPVSLGGRSGFMNPGDISGYETRGGTDTYTLAGQQVGANSWENAPPPGYAMNTPGVASRALAPMSIDTGALGRIGGGPSGTDWVGQVENHFGRRGVPFIPPGGEATHGLIGPPIAAPPIGQNPASNSNAPLLTGGVLTPPAPTGGAPINLNNLDPYTRSLVDQYGRPQIPSMQAWNAMPQSGKDAYSSFVEKVAGGNMQDLLDQQKATSAQGDAGGIQDLGFLS